MARRGLGGGPDLGGNFLQGAAVATDAQRANTQQNAVIAATMLGRQRNEVAQGQLELGQAQLQDQQKARMGQMALADLQSLAQVVQETAKIDPARAQALLENPQFSNVVAGALARANMATGQNITPDLFKQRALATIGATQTPVQAATASGEAVRAQLRAELGHDPSPEELARRTKTAPNLTAAGQFGTVDEFGRQVTPPVPGAQTGKLYGFGPGTEIRDASGNVVGRVPDKPSPLQGFTPGTQIRDASGNVVDTVPDRTRPEAIEFRNIVMPDGSVKLVNTKDPAAMAGLPEGAKLGQPATIEQVTAKAVVETAIRMYDAGMAKPAIDATVRSMATTPESAKVVNAIVALLPSPEERSRAQGKADLAKKQPLIDLLTPLVGAELATLAAGARVNIEAPTLPGQVPKAVAVEATKDRLDVDTALQAIDALDPYITDKTIGAIADMNRKYGGYAKLGGLGGTLLKGIMETAGPMLGGVFKPADVEKANAALAQFNITVAAVSDAFNRGGQKFSNQDRQRIEGAINLLSSPSADAASAKKAVSVIRQFLEGKRDTINAILSTKNIGGVNAVEETEEEAVLRDANGNVIRRLKRTR